MTFHFEFFLGFFFFQCGGEATYKQNESFTSAQTKCFIQPQIITGALKFGKEKNYFGHPELLSFLCLITRTKDECVRE